MPPTPESDNSEAALLVISEATVVKLVVEEPDEVLLVPVELLAAEEFDVDVVEELELLPLVGMKI